MRLIGTLDNEQRALQFSLFLQRKGIIHQMDISPNRDWGNENYGSATCNIWIYDEDQVPDAMKWYELFTSNPHDPEFQIAYVKPPQPNLPAVHASNKKTPISASAEGVEEPETITSIWEQKPMGIVTRLLLIGCCILFFISKLLTPIEDTPPGFTLSLFSSPVEKWILYDYPYFYESIERFIKLYGYEALEKPNTLPPEGRYMMQQINLTPHWQGIYPLIQQEGFDIANWPIQPMFEKIRQGQIWRLFSPCLFHGDLFHLFFNMIWLIVLGKQIEQRLKPMRYILFMLIVGILSNTSQYLMGGPNFVGFSGILCGMLTFIWVRQNTAPWEGYQLDRLTIMFMILFIVSMALLQTIYFFIETTAQLRFSVGIANTAHLSGALVGALLAKLNFFSWRHTK